MLKRSAEWFCAVPTSRLTPWGNIGGHHDGRDPEGPIPLTSRAFPDGILVAWDSGPPNPSISIYYDGSGRHQEDQPLLLGVADTASLPNACFCVRSCLQ